MATKSFNIPTVAIYGIKLKLMGSQETEANSSVSVVKPKVYGEDSSAPDPVGIFSLYMGTTDYSLPCKTCSNSKEWCPGHAGHINLVYPVYSPLAIKEIAQWLKILCHKCARVMTKQEFSGMSEAMKLVKANKDLVCPHCSYQNRPIYKLHEDYVTFIYDVNKKNMDIDEVSRHIVLPHVVKDIFNRVHPTTFAMVKPPRSNMDPVHPRDFVLSQIVVSATTIRPDSRKMVGGRNDTNDITTMLGAIVALNNNFQWRTPPNPPIDGKASDDWKNFVAASINLNIAVHHMMRAMPPVGVSSKRLIDGNKPLLSIASHLPKKHGRIRGNLVGRRVRNMARSVITCDVSLPLHVIGVPIKIARDIRIKEVFTPFNYERLMVYYRNGTITYPGASSIVKAENGRTFDVNKCNLTYIPKIGDTLLRDVIDGDKVNFNRQPTLETNSICSHHVKVLPTGDTIRMNVGICGLYNADFDGDEMNIHFATSQQSMYEISQMSSINRFFIAPADAAPRFGQVQDAIMGISEMTHECERINRWQISQMLGQVGIYDFDSLLGCDSTKTEFSGRDMITCLMQNMQLDVNFSRTSSYFNEAFAEFIRLPPSDLQVVIEHGVHKSGILDKSSVGQSVVGGLYHIIARKYSPKVALELIYKMQKLAMVYNYRHGWTFSLNDVIIDKHILDKINEVQTRLLMRADQHTERLIKEQIIPPIEKTVRQHYEELVINELQVNNDFLKPVISSVNLDYNCYYKMVMTGARGKLSNFISSIIAVGQLVIENGRPRESLDGRTLPYVTRNSTRYEARGYIGNSFITGLNLLEFIFHAMDARMQLIKISRGTAIAGDQTRRSVKNVEGTIIDNRGFAIKKGSVIQYVYSGDGIALQYCEKVKYPTMSLSDADFARIYRVSAVDAGLVGDDLQSILDNNFEQLKADREKFRKNIIALEREGGLLYEDNRLAPIKIDRIIADITSLQKKKLEPKAIDMAAMLALISEYCDNLVYIHYNTAYEQQRGVTHPIHEKAVEALKVLIRSYLNAATIIKHGMSIETLAEILKTIRLQLKCSMVEAGTAIGMISAHGITAISTQKELDAKHQAGLATRQKEFRRVKEIKNAVPTEKMRYPSMTLTLRKKYANDPTILRAVVAELEQTTFKTFITASYIVNEEFGNPTHPYFVGHKQYLDEWKKYNSTVIPTDLMNFAAVYLLDKAKIIQKNITMETLYIRLQSQFPKMFFVPSTLNADQVVMRAYYRTVAKFDYAYMESTCRKIADAIVRGFPGIKSATVVDRPRTVIAEDGSIKRENIKTIITAGSNVRMMMCHRYIDPHTISTNSIQETASVFGIDAAQKKIVNELRDQVDGAAYQHFEHFSYEMTYSGEVIALAHYGTRRREKNSIMSRISDSDPLSVIEYGATHGVTDMLNSGSSYLMVGGVPRSGVSYNDIVLDEEKRDSLRKVVDVDF